jgi:hypothetical protein
MSDIVWLSCQALFAKVLGDKTQVTGAQADKNAKNQAAAHALSRMANRQVSSDQAKADATCKRAKAMAAAKGGEKTSKGRAMLQKAKMLCGKLQMVIDNEQKTIQKHIKATALGEEGPTEMAKKITDHKAATAIAKVKSEADHACKQAMDMAKKVPRTSAETQKKSDMAIAEAKALCEKVQGVVRKEMRQVGMVPEEEEKQEPQIAQVKAQADEACKNAMEQAMELAKKIPLTGPNAAPMKAEKVMLEAKALCAKVNGLVHKEEVAMGVKQQVNANKDIVVEGAAQSIPKNKAQDIAQTKAQAEAACKHFTDMAKSIPVTGTHAMPAQAAKATAMAKILCAKVQGIVKKEEQEEEKKGEADENNDTKTQDRMSKVYTHEGAAEDTDDEGDVDDTDKSDNDNADWKMPAVVEKKIPDVAKVKKPIGKMPAKVANQLANEVHTVEESQVENEAKADALCAMAKKKVRDADGVSTADARSHGVEVALKFCHETRAQIAKQTAKDAQVLGKLAKHEAAKYGLKVVKMKGGNSGEEPSQVQAEKKLFSQTIGKDADFMTTKKGLKEAKNEAVHRALKKKLTQVKAKMAAHLAKEQAKVDAACKAAKDNVKKLGGKANAEARSHHLTLALKFCKKAQGLVAQERKQDAIAMKKVKAQVEGQIARSNPIAAQTSSDKAQTKKTLQKDAKKLVEKKEAKAMQKVERVKQHALKEMSTTEGAMKVKAAAMCKAMKDKVKALHTKNAANHKMALKQAKQFCKQARSLLAQEAKMDRAALHKGMQKKTSLKYHMKKLSNKEKMMKAEKEATAMATHLHRKRIAKLKAKKKALKLATEKKIEKLAIKREQMIAKQELKKLHAKGGKLDIAHKNLTASQKSAVQKQMKNNKACKNIMKNLMRTKQSMELIDEVLDEFSMMD